MKHTPQDLLKLSETEEGKDRLRVILAKIRGHKCYRTMPDEVLMTRLDEQWPASNIWRERGVLETSDEPTTISLGVPDFCRDLNACAEIELTLPDDNAPRNEAGHVIDYGYIGGRARSTRGYFEEWLSLLCERKNSPISATATQRTIALILSLQP